MNKRFWEWLSKLADKKLRHLYLKEHKVNLKCRHCNTWGHQSDKPGELTSFEHKLAVAWKCGQCGKRSYWICEAGFWLNAKEFGFSQAELEKEWHLHQVAKELDKLNRKVLVISFTGGKNIKPELYRVGGNTVDGINFITDDLVDPVQPSNEEMFESFGQAVAFHITNPINKGQSYLEKFLTEKFIKRPEIINAHIALVDEKTLDLAKATKSMVINKGEPYHDKT